MENVSLDLARTAGAEPMVYRVEVDNSGHRSTWAIVASDFVDAARRAQRAAKGRDVRVVSISPIGELL
jgi:hypothetical protein